MTPSVPVCTPARRTLRPGGPAVQQELKTLVATIWAGEAIRPSRFLILSAANLTDGPAPDHRAGGCSGLEPMWGERIIRVSDMLLRTLASGGDAWVFARRSSD